MDISPQSDIRSILVLKADRLYAETLRRAAAAIVPGAQIAVTHSAGEAARALGHVSFDLLITGCDSAAGGDALELIGHYMADSRTRRVLVVAAHLEYRVLAVLRALAVIGAFDTGAEDATAFDAALRTVANGQRYWSRSFVSRLRRDHPANDTICQSLTASEQLVLSVLGDGSDDFSAARALGLSPATISTVRRKLHRKLRVQHRGELIRVAAQNGYVRFTPSGVVRPGFALLAAECIARKRKRRTIAAAAVAEFLTVRTH